MNKKIKVCFFSRSAYPLFNPSCNATFGGAEVDLYIISKTLAKDPLFEVYCIVGDFGQSMVEHFDNVNVVKSYRFGENKLFQIFKLVVKIITVNADVYIQEGASGGTGIIAFICKIFNKKFIYRTASDIDCDGTFIKKNFIEGYLYKWGIIHSNVIITQNDSNKKQLKEILNLESIVIRNGVQIPKTISKTKNTILWVARSEKLKQPFLFLNMARQFPNEKFVMICPEANYNSVNINDLKEEALAISNLAFIPYVPFSQINSYYNEAKIFINTSTYEGFPNTFVQSVVHGVPIISLNVNPDNFLEKNNCGICVNGDMDKIISKIKFLLMSKNEWDAMSANAYAYAIANHNIDDIIADYKSIIIGN